eukprot:gene29121-38563_t
MCSKERRGHNFLQFRIFEVLKKKESRIMTLLPRLQQSCIIVFLHIFIISHARQVFPSTAASWCLPGYWQKPADNTTLLIANSSWAVENWELQNADLAFGADYGVANNKRIVVTGYMYNQMLSYDPSAQEMSMKLRTLNSSTAINYEDFFLHFKEDTEFIVPLSNVYLSSWTSLRGVPWIFGWTFSPDH